MRSSSFVLLWWLETGNKRRGVRRHLRLATLWLGGVLGRQGVDDLVPECPHCGVRLLRDVEHVLQARHDYDLRISAVAARGNGAES